MDMERLFLWMLGFKQPKILSGLKQNSQNEKLIYVNTDTCASPFKYVSYIYIYSHICKEYKPEQPDGLHTGTGRAYKLPATARNQTIFML